GTHRFPSCCGIKALFQRRDKPGPAKGTLYLLLITKVGTMPPPELTLANSVDDSRVKADPTLPLKSKGSRSTSCSVKFIDPSSPNAGNISRAVGTRSCTR